MMTALAAAALLILSGYCYWRFIWFFRNPPCTPPPGDSILSPADGTVVYVREVQAGAPVIAIKQGVAAAVDDIVREDLAGQKLLIGIFMSPFDVHYNRAPLDGKVDFVRHYRPRGGNRHMGWMHLRTLFNRPPYHQSSMHVVRNERTVTGLSGSYRGSPISCYVVQIAGKSVRGIVSFVKPGRKVARGAIFGMIRIGSQVDLVVPLRAGMRAAVKPGDRVRAGETVLIP